MNLKNKTILITGGTGSFGNAFVNYSIKNNLFKKIIIFSRDEMKQWFMKSKYQKHLTKLRFFIGDVRDYRRLEKALIDVDMVIHAAATKIVSTAEYDPFECVKTNVVGAMNVIDACINRNIPRVLALSTDKACNPINLYGSTKLASDKLFIASNHYASKSSTKFSIMRYGNVISSRGSVIPFFLEMKNLNKSLPVTDKNMTRFFISLNDAVISCLDAFSNMIGGEIFVKKCKSLKILDLAKAVSKNIKIIGIRPGEKIHEIMIDKNETNNTFEFKDHFRIVPRIFSEKIVNQISKKGKLVQKSFEYASNVNNDWFSKKEIDNIINSNS